MVFRDGSALTGRIQPIRAYAWAGVDEYDVAPVYPAANDRVAVPHPTLKAYMASQGIAGEVFAIQYQISTSSVFSGTTFDQTFTDVENGAHQALVSPATLTANQQYYWRVRAGDGAGTWGSYTAAIPFTYDPNIGRGYSTVMMNIGSAMIKEDVAISEVYTNVGFLGIYSDSDRQYMYLNVGPEIRDWPDAWDNLYLGDVTTDTPTPHIWWLKPSAGRAGDGIQIICFGAGDLQVTFAGVVEIFKDGEWEPLSVNSWQVYPPTVNAYTEDRTLDRWLSIIDAQHQIIEITVPPGSVPPGHSLRIRTNGP